ncbi:MAG: hypothetical protein Q9182_005294 [Xanthomendoza sp. 2 TL-2023]
MLSQALSAVLPRASGSRYSGVNVLILSWEDDDLDVATEITELESVFSQLYNYETDQYRIPSTQSHIALTRRILESLLTSNSSDKLFIVYYGGHGYMNDQRDCPDASTIQWSSIQTTIGQADSDVLILLDCCAAASSAGGSSKGHTEVMGACGFETGAPGVGDHSFTRSLIEELRYYGGRGCPAPISTAFLYNKVLGRAKNSWNPRYERDASSERRRTPVHIHLADRSKQRCIELVPMRIPPASNSSPSVGSTFQAVSAVQSSASSSTLPSEDVDISDAANEVLENLREQLPRVLISVAFEQEQILRFEDWLDWLRSCPALARCIHLESVYQSDSHLLLVSVPVALWDMLPKNPAITFVSFVWSGDLLTSKPSLVQNQETESSMHKTLRAPLTESVLGSERLANVDRSSLWERFKSEPHWSFMTTHRRPKGTTLFKSLSNAKISLDSGYGSVDQNAWPESHSKTPVAGSDSGYRSVDKNASSESISKTPIGSDSGYGLSAGSTVYSLFNIVVHQQEGGSETVAAQIDTGADANVISKILAESLGLTREKYKGAKLASLGGITLSPEWQTTFSWHIKGKSKIYTSTFLMLDPKFCGASGVLIGTPTIQSIGLYLVNNPIFTYYLQFNNVDAKPGDMDAKCDLDEYSTSPNACEALGRYRSHESTRGRSKSITRKKA